MIQLLVVVLLLQRGPEPESEGHGSHQLDVSVVGEGGRGRRRLMSDESVPAAQYYENKHRLNSLMQQL